MKTNTIFKRTYLLAAVLLVLGLAYPLSAQSGPPKEILVYFASGVERTAKGLSSAHIVSPLSKATLARFNIAEKQVSSAFPDFDEADTLKRSSEGRIIGVPNIAKIFRIQVPDGVQRQTVIDSLKKLPNVLFAELNGGASLNATPQDTYFSYQGSLQAGGGSGKIQAPEAWDIYTGSSNSIIAVIDYGVDGTHPDLNGKVTGDAPTTEHHGTHVAGIAAAKTNNNTGIAGVDWNAQLLSKNIEGTDDATKYQKIVDAVNYSANVNVLNSSWYLAYEDQSPGRYSTTVRMAFAYAYKMNRVAVASMGNTGNTTNTVQYPASFGQGIIAVGATGPGDARWTSSTYGNAIDVTAPGVAILSTYRNGNNFYNQQGNLDPNYQYMDETSVAAPHVSGIASLLKGYNANLYNDDIEHIIPTFN